MASINPQIDAAGVQWRARAAEFDETKSLSDVFLAASDEIRRYEFIGCAMRNLRSAQKALMDGEDATPHLCDSGIYCALALSVLPAKEGIKP